MNLSQSQCERVIMLTCPSWAGQMRRFQFNSSNKTKQKAYPLWAQMIGGMYLARWQNISCTGSTMFLVIWSLKLTASSFLGNSFK